MPPEPPSVPHCWIPCPAPLPSARFSTNTLPSTCSAPPSRTRSGVLSCIQIVPYAGTSSRPPASTSTGGWLASNVVLIPPTKRPPTATRPLPANGTAPLSIRLLSVAPAPTRSSSRTSIGSVNATPPWAPSLVMRLAPRIVYRCFPNRGSATSGKRACITSNSNRSTYSSSAMHSGSTSQLKIPLPQYGPWLLPPQNALSGQHTGPPPYPSAFWHRASSQYPCAPQHSPFGHESHWLGEHEIFVVFASNGCTASCTGAVRFTSFFCFRSHSTVVFVSTPAADPKWNHPPFAERSSPSCDT
mmetsp:Transcript_28010/g.32430  ORF Transcript_28010/g.32430 Transcript_28010/m.32430 type:complete len:300 (-) Transcript_28010:1200-2099(-)